MRILVTGTAGFIGNALAIRLLQRGDEVMGIDNLNDYYSVALKQARLDRLSGYANHAGVRADLEDRRAMEHAFAEFRPQRVVNLAAQPGVRYSLIDPDAYISSNIVGFMRVLELCKSHGVEHLVFASSSSVYGANAKTPFSEHDPVDHPVSLYAATKRSNELLAHTYSHLYGLPATGLRFFTVYGPWGRPDMSPCIFAEKIMSGQPIEVFNGGRHERDFTYIDDIVEGVVRIVDKVAQPCLSAEQGREDPARSMAPFRLYNIGSGRPVRLLRYIELLEDALGATAEKIYRPMQPGDIENTWADVTDLERETGFRPSTTIEQGVRHFVDWYSGYHAASPR